MYKYIRMTTVNILRFGPPPAKGWFARWFQPQAGRSITIANRACVIHDINPEAPQTGLPAFGTLADGAIITFDATSFASYQYANHWKAILDHAVPHLPAVLVGNVANGPRTVPMTYINNWGCPYVEVSNDKDTAPVAALVALVPNLQ